VKILITGGAGYIGSILTPMLLNSGNEVTVIDNLMYNQTPLLDYCLQPQLTVIRGDVRDAKLLEKQVKIADAIFPLACLTGAPLCDKDPDTARSVNFEAVKTIMNMKSPSQIMVFPNTNSGYGVGQDGLHFDETSPLNPISLYGKLKVELENYLLNTGECTTFRFATVFGMSPRMRLDLLVNDFVYRAVNDHTVVLFEAHFMRNFIHVRDAASAFIHALDCYDSMKGRPYNVGLSGANLSKEGLCQKIQKQLPKFHYVNSEIGEDPDKRNYIVSNERIESTGYKTSIALETGISELIKGYQIIRRNQFSNV